VTPRREVSKRLLMRRVAHWREQLHLTDWAVTVEYRPLNREVDGQAHNQASPEYREAVLRFDPRALSRANLDAFVVHELLHCHVWPLAHVTETLADRNRKHLEWSRLEEESLVTRLERLVLALVQKP
jgi:hypothetical protein